MFTTSEGILDPSLLEVPNHGTLGKGAAAKTSWLGSHYSAQDTELKLLLLQIVCLRAKGPRYGRLTLYRTMCRKLTTQTQVRIISSGTQEALETQVRASFENNANTQESARGLKVGHRLKEAAFELAFGIQDVGRRLLR